MNTAPTTRQMDPSAGASVPPNTRHARFPASSTVAPRGGQDIRPGHESADTHVDDAGSEQDIPNGQVVIDSQAEDAVGGSTSASPAIAHAPTKAPTPVLADPTLALLADVLDDLERTRIANENRLRQLTRTETDKDGEERGFGLSPDHPDVARLAGVVDGITALEHQATLNLNRAMRKHPLGEWVKTQKGVGEKQAARLLAAIGDPYWNSLHGRPRTVSELWAYCGLHVLPASHPSSDIHRPTAGGINLRTDQPTRTTHVSFVDAEQSGNPDQPTTDTHISSVGVAAKRRKGEKANWSNNAKMRAWNIAGSMLKAGNREVYDKRKTATEGHLHQTPCVRCGPSGHPAQPGSPWSDAHRHADALRIVSKALLRDLWIAARDIHLGHAVVDAHVSRAEVEQP